MGTAKRGLLAILLVLLTPWVGAQQPVPGKKGVGLAESDGLGEHQLKALKVDWFYNWGPATGIHTDIAHVPMAFSVKSLDRLPKTHVLLGFNEPDNAKQSNLSVEQALKAWPALAAHAALVGSPAMAGDPVAGDWLPRFMQAAPKVDFVAVHWYKGADAQKFIKDISAVCKRYGKPVWVTEYAPSTAGNGRKSPDKFTQQDVVRFVQATVSWMNNEPCVARYAWHDAKQGTSALFDANGRLTPTGEAYAQAK